MKPDRRDEVPETPMGNKGRGAICVLATLPPPVTGMTLATKHIVQAFQDSGETLVHDWSVGSNPRRFGWRLIKAVRSLWSIYYLVIWRLSSHGRLYTVANAGYGLYYNIPVIACARLLGYRCVIHHHVFSYLHRFDWRMNVIAGLIGRSGMHIFLAPEMKQRFTELYGEKSETFILRNTFVMTSQDRDPQSIRKWSRGKPLILGHLSNLTIEKGLSHVIATFEQLRLASVDVRLILAGPVSGMTEKSIIAEAMSVHGDAMEYRGPVYGADKVRFFDDIDVFLFPSEYRNEAQPLVVLEAINCSRPVIAYGLACLPSMVGSDGGVIVPCGEKFAVRAALKIQDWVNNPESFLEALDHVEAYSEVLRNEAEDGLNTLVSLLRS